LIRGILNIIRDILQQGVFGGVYKLVAVEENGTIIPKIKMSENVVKITNPGYKKVFRFH